MPVSPEFVSIKEAPHGVGSARILIVGVSWLGDGIMAMPALAAFRKRLPGAHITMLAKPSVAALWSIFPGIDEVIPLRKGFSGMRDTIRAVRKGGFDFAYILPKSFRSAWIPFLAGIPGRRGLAGNGRGWMLTEKAVLSEAAVCGHQSIEIADVLHLPHGDLELPPFLVVSDAMRERARSRLKALLGGADADQLIAFFPGSAHGPSKRWPAPNFAAVGCGLVSEPGCRVLILGSRGDKVVCDEVAAGIGEGAVNLAGETDFLELISLISLCRCVVANDSGGMHLAAGLGIPVIGLFGLTDPSKTAPVGTRQALLCAEGVQHSRDIDPDSPEARAAIASIPIDAVMSALAKVIARVHIPDAPRDLRSAR
ncbi:MAG: lipopolysaccharide heptosyltransferase II [bacterium]